MPKVILASTSKYRAALLQRWALDFTAAAPGVDEDSFKSRGLSPRDLVRELSLAKARAVAKANPDAIVIGSDQVLSHGDKIYGKSASLEDAVDELMTFRGRRQELLTGLAVLQGSREEYHLDVTTLTMRDYSREEARGIVARDHSWDCAGSLKIEAGGTWLIESLATQDPSAIEGLPLIALGKILRSLGLFI